MLKLLAKMFPQVRTLRPEREENAAPEQFTAANAANSNSNTRTHIFDVPPLAPLREEDWAQPIIDEIESFGLHFDPLLPGAFRKWLDELNASILAIDDQLLEIALEGEEIVDELHSIAPDLIENALLAHPLEVGLAALDARRRKEP